MVTLKRLCLGLGVASLVSVYAIGCGPSTQPGAPGSSGKLQDPEVAGFEAIQEYSTSKGTVFKKIKHPTFGEAWVEPSGLLWSSLQKISETDNTFASVTFESAQKICEKIGGRIPTNEEAGGDSYERTLV